MTETTQIQSTNLQHSISRSIYSCVLTRPEFPSKEHELKVPEPPLKINTAPPWVIGIYHQTKFRGIDDA